MPKSFQYKFHKGLEFYQPLPQSAGGFRLGSASKVAILGSHGTLAYTPWDDKSWALWAHAACRGDYRRTPDVFFDLHKLRIRYEDDELTQPKDRFKPYIHWLSRQLTPILMWERYPQVPAAVRYPHERILTEYQPKEENVFTNHASWAIALAITRGVTDIGLFGVNYGSEKEKQLQRESLVYWIGYARALGINVITPRNFKYRSSILCRPMELYGPESHTNDGELIESYRPKKETVDTPEGAKTLTIVGAGNDSELPPLMDIGEAAATSRAPGLPKKVKDHVK